MSDRPTGEERIADPHSHFPYKHDDALAGAARSVRRLVRDLELDDQDAEDALIAALLPYFEAEIHATARYVEAQEGYLRDQSGDTRAAERTAADELQNARAEKRTAQARLFADAQNAGE